MQLRIARDTNKIEEIKIFYNTILNLEILGEFQKHDGYDGIFIGKPTFDWHLEFTTTTQQEYDEIIERLELHQIKPIKSKNPYWNENGISFLDPDGFVVIVSPLKIK